MGVKVKGLKKLIKKFQRFPRALDAENKLILKRAGIAVQRKTRTNHRYNNPPHMMSDGRRYSPSGNLDRSISYRVTQKQHEIAVRVYIDPTFVTSNGYNYGLIQHDGMGSGYKPSPFSRRHSTTGRNNLRHDWFLYDAWRDYYPTMKRELRRAPLIAWRKA